VEFLGHVLTYKGHQPNNPGKETAVQTFPAPHNVPKLHQFLGLTSYYRRFIANFTKIASPLHQLTKKKAGKQVFELLKERLISAPA